MEKRLTFLENWEVNNSGKGQIHQFRFSLVNKSLIGTEQEDSSTTFHEVNVFISSTLMAIKKLTQLNRPLEICYEYAQRELIDVIRNHHEESFMELDLISTKYIDEDLFHNEKISMKSGSYVDIEIYDNSNKML